MEMLISTCNTCEMVKLSSDMTKGDFHSFGLRDLGSGISREVYELNDSWVIKMMSPENHCFGAHHNANENEVTLWEMLTDDEKESDTLPFAKIAFWADDYSWLIMERIPHVGNSGTKDETARELLDRFQVDDLHGGNYGERENGSFAIVDYGTHRYANRDRGEWSERSRSARVCGECNEPAHYCGMASCGHCGDHDCDACWPDGCTCDSVHGCKVTLCSMCVRSNDKAVGRLANGNLHELVRAHLLSVKRRSFATAETHREDLRVCRDHADKCDALELEQASYDPHNDPDAYRLPFDNRFQIGCEIVQVWDHVRGGYKRTPNYYVRDMLARSTDNGPSQFGLRVWAIPQTGPDGFAEIAAMVRAYNRDNANGNLK